MNRRTFTAALLEAMATTPTDDAPSGCDTIRADDAVRPMNAGGRSVVK